MRAYDGGALLGWRPADVESLTRRKDITLEPARVRRREAHFVVPFAVANEADLDKARLEGFRLGLLAAAAAERAVVPALSVPLSPAVCWPAAAIAGYWPVPEPERAE